MIGRLEQEWRIARALWERCNGLIFRGPAYEPTNVPREALALERLVDSAPFEEVELFLKERLDGEDDPYVLVYCLAALSKIRSALLVDPPAKLTRDLTPIEVICASRAWKCTVSEFAIGQAEIARAARR